MPTSALPRPRLTALLEQMRGRRVVVVGDAMLDRYLIGDTERISPEAPVPVVSVTERRLALGGAANVAANVAALGGQAKLVAVVGADRDGEALRGELGRLGIDDRFLLALPDRPTTTKTRVVARGQQVVRIDEEDAGELAAETAARLAAPGHRGHRPGRRGAARGLRQGRAPPRVIAATMQAAAARAAHRGGSQVPFLLRVSRRDGVQAQPAGARRGDPGIDLSSARALVEAVGRLQVENLLLTLGAGGMVLVNRDAAVPPHLIESEAREVYDVSGAGDTVTAWVGTALAAKATPIEAAEVANIAAGVEVAKRGVATVSPAEVLAAHRGA
ncbi:MAG: hypothetical protein IPG75_15415 [Gemmatimonadetes bacterium]|nr:hypothetical protein [Gemmatimonadota bacterium]